MDVIWKEFPALNEIRSVHSQALHAPKLQFTNGLPMQRMDHWLRLQAAVCWRSIRSMWTPRRQGSCGKGTRLR